MPPTRFMRMTTAASAEFTSARATRGVRGVLMPVPPDISKIQVDIPQEAFLAVLRVD